MIIWLPSYPKSGNTWLRYFILSLLFGNKKEIHLDQLKNIQQFPSKSQFEGISMDFNNIREVAKNWIPIQSKVNRDKQIRFYKTHNIFCKIDNSSFTNYNNSLGVIYIVRDPRNVITSIKNHFHYNNYKEAKEFIFDEIRITHIPNAKTSNYPLPQFIGSWQTHYKSWKNMNKNFLLIKYENLLLSPETEFQKIADHLEKLLKTKFNKEQVHKAIDNSSYDRLKKMEEKHGFFESVINKKTGERKKFFYLGPKNNWRNILDETIVDEINNKFEPEMKELGYL